MRSGKLFSEESPTNEMDRDWFIVAACAICLMFSVGTLLFYSFGVFVRPLTLEFHCSRTQIPLCFAD